mgnify:CR=1 FL=1
MYERIKLIIGHVAPTSARVWVRGPSGQDAATVFLYPEDSPEDRLRHTVPFDLAGAPAGVLDVEGLRPSTRYLVDAHFGPGDFERGWFRTFPLAPEPFRFLSLSCNKNKTGRRRNYQRICERWLTRDLAFLMHCGDQVYYDHESDEERPPSRELYAERYDLTWGHDDGARRMLGHFPNYMILDDHEIANDFNKDGITATEGAYEVGEYLEHGLPAYETFQHSHNPPTEAGQFYYNFECAGAHFFVLDVRLDRIPAKSNAPQGAMISAQQLESLKAWLLQHRDDLKFVVSPLPFLGEVAITARAPAEKKWNSPDYRGQRDEIIVFLHDHGIDRLVFLTGDMHASYHATLEFTPRSDDEPLTIHELMTGPIFHKLRPYADLGLRNFENTWSPGMGCRATANIEQIHARRSAVEVLVDPTSGDIGYHIVHLKSGKVLEMGSFTV